MRSLSKVVRDQGGVCRASLLYSLGQDISLATLAFPLPPRATGWNESSKHHPLESQILSCVITASKDPIDAVTHPVMNPNVKGLC